VKRPETKRIDGVAMDREMIQEGFKKGRVKA